MNESLEENIKKVFQKQIRSVSELQGEPRFPLALEPPLSGFF
jgi:hypothetical protein